MMEHLKYNTMKPTVIIDNEKKMEGASPQTMWVPTPDREMT